MAEPTVKLNGPVPPAPRLLWYPVLKGKEEGGEILAAFELFLVRWLLLVQFLVVEILFSPWNSNLSCFTKII